MHRSAFVLALLILSFACVVGLGSLAEPQSILRWNDDGPGRSSCLALVDRLRLNNTDLISVTHVAPGSTIATAGSCQSNATVSNSICRIYAQVHTTNSSLVKFEMWLPDVWFGRLITIGTGGLSGCIDYDNLDYTNTLHFASIATDSGHDGVTARPMLNKPEVIKDFSFRAIHVTAEIGKSIVRQYYGSEVYKSYYSACSNGGRQGIQSALLYPSDFDGILAGAPAVDFHHLLGWLGVLGTMVGAPYGRKSPSFIPDELWPVISAAIIEQCDMLDGVADGILTEPDDCHFDPGVLLCSGTANDSATGTACLTADQVTAVKKIYSPLVDPSTGVEIFPRYDPLAETMMMTRKAVFGESLFNLTLESWQNLIYNDTSKDLKDFGLKDIYFADRIDPAGLSTWSGDLAKFRENGGKIVTYHGRADGLIASHNSKRLYDLVSNTLKPSDIDDFYRLFLVPGMGHCFGGPGAWKIGHRASGSGIAVNKTSHSVLLALVDWVEGGVPPESVVGTSDDGSTREHCRYPSWKSHWNGQTWECVAVA